MAHVIEMNQWAANPERWHGELQGAPFGMGLSIIFFIGPEVGDGPRLHSHPYPETFIVQKGRALYTIGDEQVEAVAGQILVAPANTPHKFTNLGPGEFQSIDIHLSESFSTTWLE